MRLLPINYLFSQLLIRKLQWSILSSCFWKYSQSQISWFNKLKHQNTQSDANLQMCTPPLFGVKEMEEGNINNCYAIWYQKHATSCRDILQHYCFSRLLNCTNGTKSQEASHLILVINDLNFKHNVKQLNDCLENIFSFFPW